MPPVASRLLAKTPRQAQFLWCMACLRTSVHAFDTGADVPLEINCVLDSKASILCQQCYNRNSHCDTAAAGVLGDAKDFCALLKWAKDTFWEVTGEGVKAVEVYPAAIRLAVAETMQALALCFESVERAHRSLHGLGGSKGSIKAALPHYHTFLSARRLDLNDIVRPGPDADTQAWKAYRDAKLLRLVPGDDGYVLWAHGVRSFWEDIREAVRGFYETLDDTDLAGTLLAATLTDLGRTFPLVLDEEMP